MAMSSSSSSSHSPCAACKFQRRKCTQECIFAPYFPADQPQKFTNVHRVYGASNVAKLLGELNTVHREDAVTSLAYEAEARLRDPVYGCVGFISILENRLRQAQNDLYAAKKELAAYIGPQAMMIPNILNNIDHEPPQHAHHAHYNNMPILPIMPILGIPSQGSGQQQQQQDHEVVRTFNSTTSGSGCGFDDPVGRSGGGFNHNHNHHNHQMMMMMSGSNTNANANNNHDQIHELPPAQAHNYHQYPIEYQLQAQLLLHQHPHHKSDAAATDHT